MDTPQRGPDSTAVGPSSSPLSVAPSDALAVGQRLGRYEVLRQIGAGGMGVVYQARDAERGTMVALKTLHRMEPAVLLRLKNEFRFISNITHRNLVSLHELVSADDRWFMVMEYVDGDNLWSVMRHGRPYIAERRPADSSGQVTPMAGGRTPSQSPLPGTSEPTVTALGLGRADATTTATLERPGLTPMPAEPVQATALLPRPVLPADDIRRIFKELAQAIAALHASKRIHCDVKPRNVMVAKDGRVVLLDFGLSKDRSEPSASELSGTPAYISPEQILGRPATEASDWYSFGVMLYEAITGVRPFTSDGRLRHNPNLRPPEILPSPAVPDDLRQLCMALLSVEPGVRPSGREVLQRLGSETPDELGPRAPDLIGRQAQLQALLDAYKVMTGGRMVVAHVHGRSGMGKSALVRRFYQALGEHKQAVVLSGRCHERESVPYKGFDSLVDSLTRHLRALDRPQVDALTPPGIAELVRIFPVLRQVEAFAQLKPDAVGEARDQTELRQRALKAFKELLARMAKGAPLVLHLEDLQWSDQDSAAVLNELLSPPDAPRVLLICSYRTDEGGTSGLLADHRKRSATLDAPFELREVELGPLGEADAAKLAAALLETSEGDARAVEIARESHGNPLFVEELVRYARQSAGARPGAGVKLEDVVSARVKQLPDAVRRLLEVVVVAGSPISQGLALKAAAIEGDHHAPWTALRSANLVRTRGARDEDLVECYHDRTRESVQGGLSATQVMAHHLKLATLYEQAGSSPDVLARHFRGAGVQEKAGAYAAKAADLAAGALAFGHAAELYRQALESKPGDAELLEKLADALVNAGRLVEAAPYYLQAAAHSPPDKAFHLRRRAAEQYMAGGHIHEGTAVLKPLLDEVGLKYPGSPKKALLGLIGRSVQLQIKGHRFQERQESEVPKELLKKTDTAWSASKGLGSVDVMRGAYFSTRGIQLSLQSGEPGRVTRALSGLGLVTMARGTPSAIRQGEALLNEARVIAERVGKPELLGFNKVLHAIGLLQTGALRPGKALVEDAMRILEEQCTGVSWELSQARVSWGFAAHHLGEIRQQVGRSPGWIHLAEQNGDLYGAVWLKIYGSTTPLVSGDLDGAIALRKEALTGWSADAFTPQQFTERLHGAQHELYRGDPVTAFQQLDEVWKAAESAYVLAWQLTRVWGSKVRAGAAVARARVRPAEREKLLGLARKIAQRMDREPGSYARAVAALVRGAANSTAGDREGALRELGTAVAAFEEAHMSLYAACASRRKGELLGGDEGKALVGAANAALRDQGIQDVDRWTAMYAPGFSEA